MAELLVVYEGLHFASDFGFSVSSIEGDPLRAIQAISTRYPFSPNANIVSDIS
ncbi:hypothetical protein TorRG33x02_326750, partial [Trema orientale]